MNLLSLPANFGERPCDRMLATLLARHAVPSLTWEKGREVGAACVLWCALRVWQDYAIARDDRRMVPSGAEERQKSDCVAIIELFAGWQGGSGLLVEKGIEAGFFKLVPVDAETCHLVLVDFFPANKGASASMSHARLGGISKGVNRAKAKADAETREQLEMFRQTNHPLLGAGDQKNFQRALLFVHQLCNVLHRPKPVSKEWEDSLVTKANRVLTEFPAEDRDAAFFWFVANRDSQEIPPRIDFILDGFADFVSRARSSGLG
jgi:hypothetical protein